jgi:hypothetical protein
LRAESIVAQPPNQLHRVTKPRNGHGLVCALTARVNLEVSSYYGFAHSWNSRGDRHQIRVDAAYYNNWLLPWQCNSPEVHDKAARVL